MTRLWCDGPTLLRSVAAAVANLERHVDEVDALNVFPVPDGDTGSNMLATMRAALAEAERLPGSARDLQAVAEALSRGALRGARGNSGVILSQIIRGMALGADGRRRASGVELALGLRRASDVAYHSVLTPVEGTILTVIRDTAEAAETAAGLQPHIEEVLAAAIEAAARSVARTPTLLAVLEDAGVVDSGGQGLYRLLEGTFQLGVDPGTPGNGSGPQSPTTGRPSDAVRGPSDGPHATASGYGYETIYLLTASEDDLDLDLDALRRNLEAVGDSVIVAGDGSTARVHVHGQRPDLALAAGLRAGRISDVSIQDMDEQAERHASAKATPQAASSLVELALVAVAVTDAQEAALTSVGVSRVARPAMGARASAGEIAEAVRLAGAREVLILPGDAEAHLAARQAALLVPAMAVTVIDTRNVAEGVSAALAFDATATLEQNAERMAGEARGLRTLSLATAVRDALVDEQQVRRGEVLAFDREKRLLSQGEDLATVCTAALAAFEASGFELLTVYQGEDLPDARVAELVRRVADAWPTLEIEVVPGGQPGDGCLVAVE